MPELTPEIEQHLADMTDEDWRALLARVRPPNPGDGGLAEAHRRFHRNGATK